MKFIENFNIHRYTRYSTNFSEIYLPKVVLHEEESYLVFENTDVSCFFVESFHVLANSLISPLPDGLEGFLRLQLHSRSSEAG